MRELEQPGVTQSFVRVTGSILVLLVRDGRENTLGFNLRHSYHAGKWILDHVYYGGFNRRCY